MSLQQLHDFFFQLIGITQFRPGFLVGVICSKSPSVDVIIGLAALHQNLDIYLLHRFFVLVLVFRCRLPISVNNLIVRHPLRLELSIPRKLTKHFKNSRQKTGMDPRSFACVLLGSLACLVGKRRQILRPDSLVIQFQHQMRYQLLVQLSCRSNAQISKQRVLVGTEMSPQRIHTGIKGFVFSLYSLVLREVVFLLPAHSSKDMPCAIFRPYFKRRGLQNVKRGRRHVRVLLLGVLVGSHINFRFPGRGNGCEA
mmetsp:Transcript_3065/g.6820  ORF Transcript_3065/g.6820 Transcript_3065/m.6820 type:complete len:254 (-) Transcript_3065:322-1083(-)